MLCISMGIIIVKVLVGEFGEDVIIIDSFRGGFLLDQDMIIRFLVNAVSGDIVFIGKTLLCR